MPRDVEPRLLRAFAAVAGELHFTRAAARLYVAQQSLSRDIGRLERQLGTPLFVRSTRQVALTPEGERLLPYALRVLAAQDELADACAGSDRPLSVDIGAPVSTGQLVLAEARRRAPGVEFVARCRGGLAGAATEIAAGRLDVSFGRAAGLPTATLTGLDHILVRLERVAVLLAEGHSLAPLPEIPLPALAGEALYAGAGNDGTSEWTDYARSLFEGRGIHLVPPFPQIEGETEFVRVVRRHGWSVLAGEVFAVVPGMVRRPLTDPVPLSPVSMVWRRALRHPGLDALREAAAVLAARHDWCARPPHSWLPRPDTELYG